MDLDNVPAPSRDDVDTDDQSGVGVSVPRYARIGRQVSATQSVRLARDFASESILPLGQYDWNNLDVTDYVRQGDHLDSCRFEIFPVDGGANRITVHGKSRVIFYGAWSKRMEQQGKLAVLRSQLEMDMSFLWDCDERDYVTMLEILSAIISRGASVFPAICLTAF